MAYTIIKDGRRYKVNDLRNLPILPKGAKMGMAYINNPIQYTYSLDPYKGQSVYVKVPKQNGEYPLDFLRTDSTGFINNVFSSNQGYVKEITGDGYVFIGTASGNKAKSLSGRTYIQVKVLVDDAPNAQYSGNFYQKGTLWGTTGSFKNYLIWLDTRDIMYGCQFTGNCTAPEGGNNNDTTYTPQNVPTDTNPTVTKTDIPKDNTALYIGGALVAAYAYKNRKKLFGKKRR
jgi:hypothetical protein